MRFCYGWHGRTYVLLLDYRENPLPVYETLETRFGKALRII